MSLWFWKKAAGRGWSLSSVGGLFTLLPVLGMLLIAVLLMLLVTLRACASAG